MPTTLAFAPEPEDLEERFFDAPVITFAPPRPEPQANPLDSRPEPRDSRPDASDRTLGT